MATPMSKDPVYDFHGKISAGKAVPFGLQHVLAMFVGNLTPLLIITGVCGIESGSELQVALLQNAMLIAGIVTRSRFIRSDRLEVNYRLLWEPVPDLSESVEAWQ